MAVRSDGRRSYLVVETSSPGSGISDRITTPAAYAEAGIASSWRIEPTGGPAIVAYRLVDGLHVEAGTTRPGEHLVFDKALPLSIDPADLRPPATLGRG